MSAVKRVRRQKDEKEPVTNVAEVYRQIIEDVIHSVRTEFLLEHGDESVLQNLRQLWELNLSQHGVTDGAESQGAGPAITTACNPSTQLPDLNVPHGATQGYQGFTTKVEPIVFQYNPPVPTDSTYGDPGYVQHDIQRENSLPYMLQQAPSMAQNQWAVDVKGDTSGGNETFKGEAGHGQTPVSMHYFTPATGKRNRERLTTGTGNIPPPHDGSQEDGGRLLEGSAEIFANPKLPRLRISDSDVPSPVEDFSRDGSVPQWDGPCDIYDNGVLQEDYNEPEDDESQVEAVGVLTVFDVEQAQCGTGFPEVLVVQGGQDLEREEPFDEEDFCDFDVNGEVGDPQHRFEADHLVFAKVFNVKRKKNKWKCTLRHCIMNLNSKDYLFLEASGQFEF